MDSFVLNLWSVVFGILRTLSPYYWVSRALPQRIVATWGFSDAQVGLIIGTMLAVDRPIDMFRTTINIFSDSVGAVIVAKSEGETNLYPGMAPATS